MKDDFYIFKNPQIKSFPDLASFGFFCRKANIKFLENKYPNFLENRYGRGLVLHFTPSNVPLNFAYSLFFGGQPHNSISFNPINPLWQNLGFSAGKPQIYRTPRGGFRAQGPNYSQRFDGCVLNPILNIQPHQNCLVPGNSIKRPWLNLIHCFCESINNKC